MRRPHGVIENPAGTDRSPIASSGAICQVMMSCGDAVRRCRPRRPKPADTSIERNNKDGEDNEHECQSRDRQPQELE